MKRKRGRPAKNANGSKRTETLRVRVTSKEKRAVIDRMQYNGFQELSSYLRFLLRLDG